MPSDSSGASRGGLDRKGGDTGGRGVLRDAERLGVLDERKVVDELDMDKAGMKDMGGEGL